jgi:hypothetical protein
MDFKKEAIRAARRFPNSESSMDRICIFQRTAPGLIG